MNQKQLILWPVLLFLITSIRLNAQQVATVQQAYPENFTIQKKELDKLLSGKLNSPLVFKRNKYLHRALPLTNSATGDMKLLQFRLPYFRNALFTIQINGSYSTQAFVTSPDKSVFYKGHLANGDLVMKKCIEREIVSE